LCCHTLDSNLSTCAVVVEYLVGAVSDASAIVVTPAVDALVEERRVLAMRD
jgi:hypothetical protein